MARNTGEAADLVGIGQLARNAGVSSRTIRYYEELGILPEPRRSAGGTRKYPREYGDYLAAALALKDLGFRLDELRPLARLAAGRPVSPALREAAARLVSERIDELARQVVMLRRLRDSVSHPDAGVPVCAVLGGLSDATDRGAAALGAAEPGAAALGGADLGAADLGAADLGATDLGAADLGAADGGAGELGAAELGAPCDIPLSW
ncbi:MAG TPA: MerR family DNA-binding transcriptional regulator [Streptosporangiaceae bacterium]|nr:MerR family DNA-binding transcriptional regulator [Streptosporangiaceae bacterium]